MDLKSRIPTVADWPRPGVNFLDISGLLKDAEAFRTCVDHVADSIRIHRATAIIAVESRGFLFASAACAATAAPLYLARKVGKLPGDCHAITYETEYSQDTLEIQATADLGPRPLIVDDVLATGGTVLAVTNLIRQHWPVDAVGASVIINLSFLPGAQRLQEHGVDLRSTVTYA